MKSALIVSVSVLMYLLAPAGPGLSFDHSAYDSLLAVYVDEKGVVDYAGLEENHEALEEYLEELENVDPREFDTWPADERMAFWINAYNAITIEAVLRNYPIDWGGILDRLRFSKSSIRQIDDFFSTPWVPVMGKEITLDEIEHEILRKKFDEPRIHFVLVCASLGCPELENDAFTAGRLDGMLEKATRDFVRNPEKVRLDRGENTLFLSSIFDWYGGDFAASGKYGSRLEVYDRGVRGVVEFVLDYLPAGDRKHVLEHRPEISYLEYDWTLNDQKNE